MRSVDVWGGVECTVSRVGDSFIDQLELTGHAHRPDDIERIASLGVRTVRYPVLWERTAPDAPDRFDWSWSDERLSSLRAHGITPILGLLHHGSGPRYTSLLDPAFPDKLAAYAEAVATRYPWVTMVTPVNEPLTTARFSGLYGHWYPHCSDDASFVRMLLNECYGTRAAMRAIRRIAPAARLVQTEDLGYTHATPALRYQAGFENNRRWLSWDLLAGGVNRAHPMYGYLVQHGASRDELAALADDPCPPDILGIDHYVTSERFLDDRLERYPSRCHGGNGRHRYADVEVVRADPTRRLGPAALLVETWERYRIPIVITEAYLSCDDEHERVRWLFELYSAAEVARERGCEVLAVTAWALFGARGWDELATRRGGKYDAGAFDAGGASFRAPHETALSRAVRALTRDGWVDDVPLDQPGWWHPSASRQGATRLAS